MFALLVAKVSSSQELAIEEGQWWTIGSAGGPAGTTGLTSASWWNHGDTTKAWQQNLASVQSLAEVNVRKPRIATEHKPKQAVSGKTMPGFCSPFC
uniref:Uncharacterized protein n=1 Tax=Cryptomonas curvata TaxID=233186 RepID=A0A7S0QFC8_9CRYP